MSDCTATTQGTDNQFNGFYDSTINIIIKMFIFLSWSSPHPPSFWITKKFYSQEHFVVCIIYVNMPVFRRSYTLLVSFDSWSDKGNKVFKGFSFTKLNFPLEQNISMVMGFCCGGVFWYYMLLGGWHIADWLAVRWAF